MLLPVDIDDPALPAASHLMGDAARDVVGAAVQAAGGRLGEMRTRHLHYRPGSDVVAQFAATVDWGDGAATRETLLASTRRRGPIDGTIPVVADHDGTELHVGVWRWPHDPALPGLATAVTPARVERWRDLGLRGPVALQVVAFRPTERCVVRATDRDDRVRYVKVVTPTRSRDLVERHDCLRRHGVPVPEVVAHDPQLGLVAMEELSGPTLRDRLKQSGPEGLPHGAEIHDVVEAIGRADLREAAPVPCRLDHAVRHAAMLREVLPTRAATLDALAERFAAHLDHVRAGRRPIAKQRTDDPPLERPNVHGDLHEGQLIVRDSRVVGVLDIDEVGPGDPVGDLANLLGHLRYRSTTADSGRLALAGYADSLRRAHVAAGVDDSDLDIRTAATLVGLATGPFRLQRREWRRETARHLDHAARLARVATNDRLR